MPEGKTLAVPFTLILFGAFDSPSIKINPLRDVNEHITLFGFVRYNLVINPVVTPRTQQEVTDVHRWLQLHFTDNTATAHHLGYAEMLRSC